MPTPRKPTAVLELFGAFKHNPSRLRDRENEPVITTPLPEPPKYLTKAATAAWFEMEASGFWLKSPDQFLVAIAATLVGRYRIAVEMRCGQLRPSIALGKQPYCAKSVRGTSVARNVAVYVTAGTDRPNVTSTISGGTPRRNGTMLQPRPPETMTSQLVRVWP
jgi:hypothetical protein